MSSQYLSNIRASGSFIPYISLSNYSPEILSQVASHINDDVVIQPMDDGSLMITAFSHDGVLRATRDLYDYQLKLMVYTQDNAQRGLQVLLRRVEELERCVHPSGRAISDSSPSRLRDFLSSHFDETTQKHTFNDVSTSTLEQMRELAKKESGGSRNKHYICINSELQRRRQVNEDDQSDSAEEDSDSDDLDMLPIRKRYRHLESDIQTCQKVYERSRGSYKLGDRCRNPADSSGYCDTHRRRH